LLAQAFEVLARDIKPPAIAARCCAELAEAAGALALVGGQVDDLGGEFTDGNVTRLEEIHRRKTGAMFLVSLRLGGLVAEADDPQQQGLEAYGRSLGLAFQIVDDLLDVQGDEAAIGKRTKKDADRGKMTFPSVLGASESRIRAEQLIEAACQAVAPIGPRAAHLQALARYVLERTH
ncbi:MAG: polyprenyl synthetase family protein, partial [Pirellulaceae bacterium]